MGKCRFCNKKIGGEKLLFTSSETDIAICEDCVAIINEFMFDRMNRSKGEKPMSKYEETLLEALCAGCKDSSKESSFELPKTVKNPREIKEKLDETIVGQEDAKKTISVAVYNHMQRILHPEKNIQKSNILLLGPSGSGKTMLARALAEILNVPFVIADATSLTQAGYVGEDVESILARLLQAANGDVESAERGIIFIDEIDKIAKRGGGVSTSTTRDVAGEGVQQALLKILEGTVLDVPFKPGRRDPRATVKGETFKLNTKNILFICGGAFSGMKEAEAEEEKETIRPIGFCAKESKMTEKVKEKSLEEQLIQFGITPEFLGRLPVHVELDALGKEAFLRILRGVKGSLCEEYSNLFATSEIRLSFAEEALDEIADYALAMHVGARGLRSVMEKVLIDALFELPGSKRKSFKVTKKLVNEKLNTKEVA